MKEQEHKYGFTNQNKVRKKIRTDMKRVNS